MIDDPDPLPEARSALDRLVLDKAKYAAMARVSAEVLDTAQFATFVEPLTDDLVIRFTADVLSDRILTREYEATVRFPSNPWQHAKDRFAPRWFRRRRPVRLADTTVVLRVDVDARYPNAQVPMGGRLGPVVFHETGSVSATRGPAVRASLPEPTYRQLRAGDRTGGGR